MTGKPCPRLWQIEAARDGRLAGSDLSNALRHRAECADCSREMRALSELGLQLKTLPVEPPDRLQRRRTRQALLGAWNEHLLAAPEPKHRLRVALVAAFCTASALALAVGYPLARERWRGTKPSTPFFEVVVKPGASWAAREAPNVTRITLRDGFATFTVRRPAGQQLFVDLPDGEIEDLGTVFDVLVRNQRTVQVNVDQGRVFVRLNGRPGFELNAGQSWQADLRPPPAASAPARSDEPILAQPSRTSPMAKDRVVRPRSPARAAHSSADTAEDDAYLQIVDLLRNGHRIEARAKAVQYLQRFPNGFRQQEVANIAQR